MTLKADGTMTLHCVGYPQQVLRPVTTVFTAGAGNIGLPWVAQQLRPLHMVLARGVNLPGSLYAHCLGASDLPRLTVTSHFDADGRHHLVPGRWAGGRGDQARPSRADPRGAAGN